MVSNVFVCRGLFQLETGLSHVKMGLMHDAMHPLKGTWALYTYLLYKYFQALELSMIVELNRDYINFKL